MCILNFSSVLELVDLAVELIAFGNLYAIMFAFQGRKKKMIEVENTSFNGHRKEGEVVMHI